MLGDPDQDVRNITGILLTTLVSAAAVDVGPLAAQLVVRA